MEVKRAWLKTMDRSGCDESNNYIIKKYCQGYNNYMTLKLLRILTIVSPVIFIGLFELARHYLFIEENPMIIGNVILLTAVTVAAFFFSRYIFGIIDKTQKDNLRRNEELKTLNSVAYDINKSLNLDVVLRKALSRVIETTHADSGEILLLDDDKKIVERVMSSGFFSEEVNRNTYFTSGEFSLAYKAIVEQGLLIHDLNRDDRFSENQLIRKEFRSLIAVPLLHESNSIGVVLVASITPGHFNDNDLQLLNNMGYQISLAVENARLHEQVKEIGTIEERERIAREMHDGIAQVLTFVGMKSQAARQFLITGQTENANDQLLRLEEVARDLYADVREVILGLRSNISATKDMASNLKEYLSRFSHMSNIKTELEITDGSIFSLPSSSQTQILYIIQEALSNIRKHAKANNAHVTISNCDSRIEITVSDDGRGFSTSSAKQNGFPHFGIQIMKERMNSMGGNLEIKSRLGEGTKVVLALPIEKEI